MKPYTLKHNARRAAKARLGCAATEGEHFTLVAMDGGWIWVDGASPSDEQIAADVKAAQEAAQDAQEASDGPMGPDTAPATPAAAEMDPVEHVARTGMTKGDVVLGLLKRKGGATNPEIQAATGWLPHTVRGFFAGKQLRRTGYAAERFRRDDHTWAYRAKALADAAKGA